MKVEGGRDPCLSLLSFTAFEQAPDKAKYSVLLYICGSLERLMPKAHTHVQRSLEGARALCSHFCTPPPPSQSSSR